MPYKVVAVSIDGGAETNIDLYSSTEEHGKVYYQGAWGLKSIRSK